MKHKFCNSIFYQFVLNLKKRISLLRNEYVKDGRLIIDFSSNISKKSRFEGLNSIKNDTNFNGCMGYGSYIGPHCEISAHIGRFTSIAPYVHTNHGKHPFKAPFVTTSPHFFSIRGTNGRPFAKEQLYDEFANVPTIGNDCWIGHGCFIAGDVTISDGAVVLAGSYVVSDVPAYAVVGGVPARILRYRYTEEQISKLLQIKWWNNSISWFEENWKLLSDVNLLFNYYGL